MGTYADVQAFTSYFTSIKFGFTPIITKANFLHPVIEQIQLTQILSETDSPYFTPDEVFCSVQTKLSSVRFLSFSYRHIHVVHIREWFIVSWKWSLNFEVCQYMMWLVS